jgi:Protein of unknown function (DUF1116)
MTEPEANDVDGVARPTNGSSVAQDLDRRIDAANAEAVRRLDQATPVLVDVLPAREVVPGLGEKMVLHSGPPVGWGRMSGAQRGAVIGMLLFEGWASSPEEAVAMLDAGEVELDANHEHQAVGPMAGTISPSLPLYVVEDLANGTRGLCRNVEGMQQFGVYGEPALAILRAWRDVHAPALSAALRHAGPVELKPLFARGIDMGDELHNRPNATTLLFGVDMGRRMVRAGVAAEAIADTLDLCYFNPYTALGLSMAAGKAMSESLRDLEYSTVVRVMARNGTEFGIKVAGLGDQWFVAPAPLADGLYWPGFTEADANRDMGDSAITETVGWGGCVIAGAPGILALTGGTPADALEWTRHNVALCLGRSSTYKMPALGFEGAPIAIDIRKVVDAGTAPVIDSAIAHKEPGIGMIGSGIVRAPLECFRRALRAFEQRYGAWPAEEPVAV